MGVELAEGRIGPAIWLGLTQPWLSSLSEERRPAGHTGAMNRCVEATEPLSELRCATGAGVLRQRPWA